jgi:hypothetical protein
MASLLVNSFNLLRFRVILEHMELCRVTTTGFLNSYSSRCFLADAAQPEATSFIKQNLKNMLKIMFAAKKFILCRSR